MVRKEVVHGYIFYFSKVNKSYIFIKIIPAERKTFHIYSKLRNRFDLGCLEFEGVARRQLFGWPTKYMREISPQDGTNGDKSCLGSQRQVATTVDSVIWVETVMG